MADNQKHEGWTNWYTSRYKTFIYGRRKEEWINRATSLLKEATASTYATKQTEATAMLAEELEEDAFNNLPDIPHPYSDILDYALNDIAYFEIAKSIMKDAKSTEKKSSGGVIDFLSERISLKDIITK